MNLTGLRYWQWAIIGLIVGSGIGWAWTGTPSELPRSGDPADFTRAVSQAASRAKAGQPAIIRNVVVYPYEVDPNDVKVYPVTYEMPIAGRDGKLTYQQWLLNAKSPYVDQWTRTEYPSINDYLTKHEVAFTDRAGGSKYLPVAYGAAGGLLAIGLLWPTTIQLLINAGLATAPPPRERKAKLDKSKIKAEDYGTDKAGPRGISSGDVSSLNALNDGLEQRLAAGLKPGDASRDTVGPDGEPVSVFMSGNVPTGSVSDPTAPAVAAEPDKPKDYKGDYYPVARPAAKKDDAAH